MPGAWRQFKLAISVESRCKKPLSIEVAVNARDHVSDAFWDFGSEGLLEWFGHIIGGEAEAAMNGAAFGVFLTTVGLHSASVRLHRS